MILRYDLPKEAENKISLSSGEKIYYAVPFDIDENGNWTKDSYIVVTTLKIHVFSAGDVRTFSISDLESAKAEPGVGGGVLTVKMNGQHRVLAHYSSGHLSRYAYVARGINILISGRFEEVISNEYEKICPHCGRVIPGTKTCPKCSGEGRFLGVFLKMAGPYKKHFFWIFFLMIMAAVTTLLNPEVQKHLINNVLKEGGDMKTAMIFLVLMFILSVSIVIVNVLKSNASARLGSKIASDLRGQLFEKYQKLPLSFINDRRPGELLNRITQDTRYISDFMADVFCNLFAVFFIFIWDVIFMLVINTKLALITFILVPVVSVIMISFRKTISRIFHLQYKKNDDVSSDLQDVISGMRVVKTYGKEKEESDRFKAVAVDFALIQKRNERFWAMFDFIVSFLMGMGVVIVVYFGGLDVFEGSMSAGELYQFITYTLLLFQYVGWLGRLPREISRLTSSLERIYDILAQDVEEEASDLKEFEIKGEITFDHATFGYKSYQPVLEDINAVIKPGEMIGIVGASGTGKSTLINLLMRLYETDDGRILVDGVDMKDISRRSYHSQLGVVLQETFLFSGTILDNIRFSKPDATIHEIIKAAKLANAHDFITMLPDGYNTYVGEKGYTLSGGERQRIAIARAILPDPNILILDEATASLDTENEFMIQKALERLTSGKTTFAIAHRLSTLKNADRIMVIDGHHIAEIGTHSELLSRKGIYYNLYNAQIQN
ncbi:MAG: ATP-binding cassette domain-containing protein [Lachnospiraceae bacterium]|nr:ATP-binding cassette domain-containing protein [Lachnospiraceae bacterium]